MADQKKWFKVWTSITDDPHFQEMDLEDIGRWTLLGALMAEVGTRGVLASPAKARRLCQLLRFADVSALQQCLKQLTGVQIEEGKSDNGDFTVTWKNWVRYQEDSTVAERVKRLRHKRRGEERRGDEKRREEKDGSGPASQTDAEHAASAGNGLSGWPPEWSPIRDRILSLPFLAKWQAWLTDLDWWKTQDEAYQSCRATLDQLLLGAVSYITTEGYHPSSKRGLLMKLKNCLEFQARIAGRTHANEKRGG